MTIETLQSLIEDKADKELRAEILKAAQALQDICPSHTTFQISDTKTPSTTVNVTPLSIIRQVCDQIFEAKHKVNRHYAAKAFVEKVDALKEQVDELTGSIQEQ